MPRVVTSRADGHKSDVFVLRPPAVRVVEREESGQPRRVVRSGQIVIGLSVT